MLQNTHNYYDEEKVQQLLREYQKTTIVEDGVSVYKDTKLEQKIVIEVGKIVNAIIMYYKYYYFEPYEDLRQHALMACFTNFLKFNKDKGSSFNYFSLISKISLLNYTTRKKKHRDHQNIEDQIYLKAEDEVSFEAFLDNLEEALFNVVDENFLGNKRKKYSRIASLIIDYLAKTRKFVSKSDLYSWCRSYGVKNSEVREFVKEAGKHIDYLTKEVI